MVYGIGYTSRNGPSVEASNQTAVRVQWLVVSHDDKLLSVRKLNLRSKSSSTVAADRRPMGIAKGPLKLTIPKDGAQIDLRVNPSATDPGSQQGLNPCSTAFCVGRRIQHAQLAASTSACRPRSVGGDAIKACDV